MAPDERRDQLLDAVLDVIVRDGIHKVSIDSVAKSAGVARPVVYRHFDDTNQLLRASLRREEERVTAQLAPLFGAMEELPLLDGLLAFHEGLVAAVLGAPLRWRAVFMLVDSSTPAYRKRMEAGRKGLVEALESRLARALGIELAQGADVGMTARSLYALIWDAGRVALEDPLGFPAARVAAYAGVVVPALLGAAPAN
jgi:AcrR family transcriptional regulator